jgi:UDP-N-acetylglucosamine 2-epimerase (non-hydrolysing)
MNRRIHLLAASGSDWLRASPLWHALASAPEFEPALVDAGEKATEGAAAPEALIADLGLGEPDHCLEVGLGSPVEQTGRAMVAYAKLTATDSPAWLVVIGDSNSAAGCALAAAKSGVRLVHLDAGLRSGDRSMPDEINRLVTDTISDVLWTSSPEADATLRAEGVEEARISRVGNLMLDSLELLKPAIDAAASVLDRGLVKGGYGIVTLKTPSNVDEPGKLRILVEALIAAHQQLPLLFAVHPRTAQRLLASGLHAVLQRAGVLLIEPPHYVRFVSLVLNSGVVITDSRDLQYEAAYLGIPCLIVGDDLGEPTAISEGNSRLVSPLTLAAELADALGEPNDGPKVPEFWDGKTAQRCLEDLRRRSVPVLASKAPTNFAARKRGMI